MRATSSRHACDDNHLLPSFTDTPHALTLVTASRWRQGTSPPPQPCTPCTMLPLSSRWPSARMAGCWYTRNRYTYFCLLVCSFRGAPLMDEKLEKGPRTVSLLLVESAPVLPWRWPSEEESLLLWLRRVILAQIPYLSPWAAQYRTAWSVCGILGYLVTYMQLAEGTRGWHWHWHWHTRTAGLHWSASCCGGRAQA